MSIRNSFIIPVYMYLLLGGVIALAQNVSLQAHSLKSEFLDELNAKEYTKAEKLVEQLVAYYAEDGETIFAIGQLYYHLKKWDLAISSYEKSDDMGYNMYESKYNIACCYALKRDLPQASFWLQEAIDIHPAFYYQWMEDTDLRALVDNTNYLSNLYHFDRQAKTRNSKWNADIDFFNKRMQQFHYDLFQHVTQQEWDEKIVALKNKIDSIKDYQVVVELMKLTALVGDGHTVVVPPLEGENSFHLAPFLTYLFDDGLYITETHKSYRQLLGAKIMAINGVPVNEVLGKVQTVISHDNQFGAKWLMPLAISIPEILNALDISQNKLDYSIDIEKDGKPSTYKIVCTQKLTGDFMESWLYGFHKIKGWVKVHQEMIPSSQTRTEEPYWFEYLQEDELVVFHYNQVQTNPDENEAQFILRLNKFLDNNKAKALIIDLRSNEGGDNTIYKPILNGLIANENINQTGKLYVLIGRRTFSAGMCFAAALERYTNAIFIGEPTGSSPNFVGESGGVFQLPYSGIFVNASNLFWQNSYAFDNRKFISPEVIVKTNYKDYIKGSDLSFEVVKQMIQLTQ